MNEQERLKKMVMETGGIMVTIDDNPDMSPAEERRRIREARGIVRSTREPDQVPDLERKGHPIGIGRLNWDAGERISDRYGTVTLYPPDICPEGSEAPSIVLVEEHGEGMLAAKIIEARESYHIGDLFYGIYPQTPEIGDVFVLGHGIVFYEDEAVGLMPRDGREVHWLDVPALYRCHDQTVTLYFVPEEKMKEL